MLVDRLGRLVWFEPVAPGKPFDLKLQTYQGKPAMTWWEGTLIADFGYGKAQITDETFNVVKTVSAANGLNMDLHEFTITPGGAGLCTAYQIVHDQPDRYPWRQARPDRELPRAGARSADR